MAKRPKSFRKRLEETVMELLVTALTVLCIYVLRQMVESLLGKDLLWDAVPLRYWTDTMDALLLTRFIWKTLRSFND